MWYVFLLIITFTDPTSASLQKVQHPQGFITRAECEEWAVSQRPTFDVMMRDDPTVWFVLRCEEDVSRKHNI